MKIERLNPPTPPVSPFVFDAAELVELAGLVELTEPPVSTGWALDGHTLSINTAPPSAPEAVSIIKQIAAMIPTVTDWIESRCGVICRPQEFRITLPPLTEKSARTIRSPIGPIGAIMSAKCGDGELIELPAGKILHKNGYLVLEKSITGNLVIELVAGFTQGNIPQTVKHAAAIICRHWINNPTDFSEQEYREPDGLQLLQMHTPGMVWPSHAMEGGALWP